MKCLLRLLPGLLGFLFLTVPGSGRLPNVLFILADDLGWSDTTLFGTTSFYRTPNIQRLADRGMTLSDAYTASPVCTPTPASIMTGQYPARFGLTQARGHQEWEGMEATVQSEAPSDRQALEVITANRLPAEATTLAEALAEAGYVNGHFGKWHLGAEPYSPLEQGFEVDVPHTISGGPGHGYLAPWSFENQQNLPPHFEGEHLEDRMAEEACEFMEENRDRPFFLNYWAFSIHSPWSAKPDRVDAYKQVLDLRSQQRNPVYAAMVESLDDAVGTLLDQVDALGLTEKTIIVFFSDNGGNTHGPPVTEPAGWKDIPGTSSYPLRAGKGRIYEGGIRVPMVVVWPGVTAPGSRSDGLFGSVDFFPTILSMAGLDQRPDAHLDGVDQSGLFRGEPSARDTLFYYYPHYSDRGSAPALAVRQGDWKLIRWFYGAKDQTDRYDLHNLHLDIYERQNLAGRYPGKVSELRTLLDGFLAETGVTLPQGNPGYLGGALQR